MSFLPTEIDPIYVVYLFVALAAGLFVEGIYLLFFNSRSYRKNINRRLKLMDGQPDRESMLVELRRERGLTKDGEYRLLLVALNRLILQSGLTLGIGKFAIYLIVVALFAFGLVMATRGDLLEALGTTLFCCTLLPLLILKIKRGRRQKTFGAQFPDALDIIVRSLRAGHPVPIAISMVAREMADPIGSEFGIVADEITYGADLETGMRNLYFRIGQDDLPLFVTAVAIQSSTGGNLGEILENLSAVIRQRFKMRRKIRALASEGRASAMILSSLPILMFLVIQVITPDFYASVWHEDPTTPAPGTQHDRAATARQDWIATQQPGVDHHDPTTAQQPGVQRRDLTATPAIGVTPIGEERKLVTVLDADLRGVRGENGDADPERARREVAEWTDLLREVITRWGGAVQPVVGGGVIGVFGYPTAREDHADRALSAGSEILRRSPAPIRLGADTGQVIAPPELSQIGGAVLDTAARLRAAAAPRTLLVTDRTRRALLRPEFDFGDRTNVGEPSLTARPLLPAELGEPSRNVRPQQPIVARERFEAPMVGRAGELRAVLGLIDEAVTSRRPRMITITGVAGIGKTRLVHEVVARTQAELPQAAYPRAVQEAGTRTNGVQSQVDHPHPVEGTDARMKAEPPQGDQQTLRVLRGRCLAAGDGITFWALGEILREACGIPLGDPDAPQRLRSRLRRIFEGQRLTAAELDTTIFALATTAAIRLPDNPLDHADPRDVADELGRAWPRLASAFAARGPLLLVVEDLHWAGAPLVGMLSRLVTRSTGPVVLLTTARPEFLETRPDLPGVSMVALHALTADDSRTLLSAHPHADDLPPRSRARILARAEGNPYFLDQLAAHVAETAPGPQKRPNAQTDSVRTPDDTQPAADVQVAANAQQPSSGRKNAQTARTGDAGLPDTLHALLAARVDALPPAEKRLLQAAAVMGRVFWTAPLRERLGPDLPDLLAALENRALIRARPAALVTGQDEYAFQHALLRDVAYASLPVAQRAAGHAAVAAWLEEVSRERIGEVIELVAVHYAAAADGPGADDWTRGKAFRSLVTAGIGARRRYAVPRALDLHRAALRHASNPAERAGALEAIGDDHETAYDGDNAVRAWREAITALRDAPGHGDRRAGLCLKTAQMLIARWGGFRVPADPELGDRVVDEGLAAVTDPPTKAQLLSLRALCGGRWAWTGRTDPVPVTGRRRAATDAAALADRLGSPTLRGQALLGNAAVHFLEGHYEQAVTAVLAEVDLVEQEGRDRDRALGHTIASLVIGAVRGDYALALEHAHHSYDWARGLSPHDRLHGTAAVLICLEQLGRDAEIDPYLDEHLRLRQGPVAAMSCPYIRSAPLVGALVLARRGDPRESEKVAATVEPDLAHPGNAEVLRARLALHRGDVPTARALAERLVAMGRRPGPEEIPHEALVLVQTLEAAADHDALRRFLPRARAAAGYLAVLTPACDSAETTLERS